MACVICLVVCGTHGMQINLAKNKENWDNWFLSQQSNEFLQSWEWGEFQRSAQNESIRLQVVEDGNVVDQVQGFVHKLGLGFKYIYLPRIPSSSAGRQGYKDTRIQKVLEYLKKENFAFARVEPLNQITNIKYQIINTNNRQPKDTLILNINKIEDELLSEMHSKTRYNVRLAERRGVEIRQEKNIDIFWKLNEETIRRDEFKSHGKEYYARMFEMKSCYVLTAYFEGNPIASNIFIKFGDTFTYLHGASSNEFRNVMAPYLLQWEGIKLAKQLNCKYYDFWGVAPPVLNDSGKKSCFHHYCWEVNHKWTGVTRFKAGFGGLVKSYPEAIDVILNYWKYKLYRIVKKLKNN